MDSVSVRFHTICDAIDRTYFGTDVNQVGGIRVLRLCDFAVFSGFMKIPIKRMYTHTAANHGVSARLGIPSQTNYP